MCKTYKKNGCADATAMWENAKKMEENAGYARSHVQNMAMFADYAAKESGLDCIEFEMDGLSAQRVVEQADKETDYMPSVEFEGKDEEYEYTITVSYVRGNGRYDLDVICRPLAIPDGEPGPIVVEKFDMHSHEWKETELPVQRASFSGDIKKVMEEMRQEGEEYPMPWILGHELTTLADMLSDTCVPELMGPTNGCDPYGSLTLVPNNDIPGICVQYYDGAYHLKAFIYDDPEMEEPDGDVFQTSDAAAMAKVINDFYTKLAKRFMTTLLIPLSGEAAIIVDDVNGDTKTYVAQMAMRPLNKEEEDNYRAFIDTAVRIATETEKETEEGE